MTFKLNQSKSYKYPVLFHYIDEDGVTKNNRFKVAFRRLNKSQREKIQEMDGDIDIIKSVLVNWEDVEDENGETIPFSVENLVSIDDECPEFTTAIAYAWADSIKKVSEKNLKQ